MSALPFVLEVIEARRKRRRSDVAPIVRVLRIEPGKTKDAHGRGVGDDWLLCSFGAAPDGCEYHLTTDSVRGSEMMECDDLVDPAELAKALAKLVNARWRRRVEKARGGSK